MRRVLVRAVVAVTLALPASVLALTAGVPAADAHSSLTCGTVKGRATGEMTVKKCALSSAVNKKAYKELAGFSGTVESGGTLTWKPAGTTTIISATTMSKGPAALCPAKTSALRFVGTVTGGTSAVTHVGDTFAMTICTHANKFKNAEGTSVDL